MRLLLWLSSCRPASCVLRLLPLLPPTAAPTAHHAPAAATFVCRRLLQNPAYYDLEDASPEGLSEFMSGLVEDALQALADSGCVVVRAACAGAALLQAQVRLAHVLCL